MLWVDRRIGVNCGILSLPAATDSVQVQRWRAATQAMPGATTNSTSHDCPLADTTLPIMRETAQELRRLLGLHSTRNQELQRVLLSDPAAAIAVFRRLEQARPGACEKVTDAAHAVSLIGMDPFRHLLDTLPEIDPGKRGQAGSGNPASAYSEAAHAAFYAGALSDHKGLGSKQEIPTAALLQNPAVLALWTADPEAALRAHNAVRDGVSAEIAFAAELGEPLDEANRRLATAWAFPQLAQQAMRDNELRNTRPQMVRIADNLARTTSAGWQREDTHAATGQLSDFLDLSRDQACAWLHQQATEAARSLSRYNYPLPGFALMFMPGEIDDDENDDHDIPLLGGRRPHEQPARATRAPDLHTTMAGIMRRIRDESGAARIVFAMLNQDRSRLRTRLALGGGADDGLRSLDLDLSQKNLFTLLLGKTQSVWLHPGNAAKYQGHLPASLRPMLAPGGAYMMSLFIREKPLGLLYGDGGQLSEAGYRQFRTLCRDACDALGAGASASASASVNVSAADGVPAGKPPTAPS